MRLSTNDYMATSPEYDKELRILFNEISANYSVDKYVDTDNSFATSEEVDASIVYWHKTVKETSKPVGG